ncbi:MAG: cupredoxin domain-containing protein [Rhodocyclaceae bacterium]|nr:cupredoxin domain-containing protein [Rhodocyclaceae bacterium]
MKKSLVYSVGLSAYLLFSTAVHAEDFILTLKNNQFFPKVLTIPAGQKIKITVKNQDATPAEFESSDLNREKVVAANSEIIIFIGPLDAGTYGYFDDFHRDTTTGTIIAK